MRLYFIRHGQSENNALYDRTGSDDGRDDDPKLTEAGKEQCQLVAGYLRDCADPWDGETSRKGFGITHLYCSLMFRSVATGYAISQAVGVPLTAWADWHECGGMFLEDKAKGEYIIRPGMGRKELIRIFPGIILNGEVSDQGWWNRPFETDDQRVIRARRVFHELYERHGGSDDRVAVVSHGGFYMRFMAAVLGLEEIKPMWFRMNNTGITRIDFRNEENTLVFHNHVSHLPAHLLT
jgi:2,3-bisphosphoglycerate-dependent phosphoglycerate mutase